MSEINSTTPILVEENVEIRKFNDEGQDFLHFTFKNKFTEDSSVKATKAWANFCETNPTQQFVHIWDCQSMSGFDKKAKDLWMEHMNKYSSQTNKIVLVADNIIIRGAARIMSRFTKHKLEIYKTLTEMASEQMIST